MVWLRFYFIFVFFVEIKHKSFVFLLFVDLALELVSLEDVGFALFGHGHFRADNLRNVCDSGVSGGEFVFVKALLCEEKTLIMKVIFPVLFACR